MASFQVNLNMRNLHVYIGELSSTSRSNVRGALSKKEEIILKVLQADVVTNLRTCLNAYMTQNHMIGGEVCIFINFRAQYHLENFKRCSNYFFCKYQ